MTRLKSPAAVATLLLTLLAWFALLNAPAQAGSQAVPPAGASTCALTVMIYGGGHVDVQTSHGPARLEQVQNELLLECGAQVTLTAVPRERWRFAGWQPAGLADSTPTRSLTLRADATLTATFELQGVIITQLDEPIVGRNGRLTTQIAALDPAWQPAPAPQRDAALNVPPVINVWYGANQAFGQLGAPQQWINILGNVSDPDGNLSTLSYRLNSGPTRALSIGPDGRRLYHAGDFNIDLNRNELINGLNQVVITARDTQSAEDVKTVSFTYNPNTIWPLPYSVNWASAGEIQDSSQVVDGLWQVSGAGLRPTLLGYDRIVALGDLQWTDYEITVPVTVNAIDPAAYNPISGAPAIGVVLRWEGHTDTPVVCGQPKCGYLPIGVAAWYDWEVEDEGFLLWVDHSPDISKDTTGLRMAFGATYLWKVRAETPPNPDQKGVYKLKVWAQGQPEPADWLLTLNTGAKGLRKGSLLLLAHHADVIFGDVQVTQLGSVDTIPPLISDVQVLSGATGATIQWQTNEPTTGRVDYGATAAYGSVVEDPNALKTSHSFTVEGLTPDSTYHYRITARDASNNAASTADATFRTQVSSDVVSDDFNACDLDEMWRFSDPLGDAAYRMTGTALELIVPAGQNHDVWPTGNPADPLIRAPHVMQTINRVGKIAVKFDSGVSANIQMQGLLIQQDAQNLLRINFQRDNDGKVRLYVIGFRSGQSPSLIRNSALPDSYVDGPLYLTVEKLFGGQWRVAHARNGGAYTALPDFTFTLMESEVGVFAGNSSTQAGRAPAHTAVVDYFFNADAPIDPQDAVALFLPVEVSGDGAVDRNRECGNPVTLTAVPATGWQFVEWQGSPLDGQQAPVVTTGFDFDDAVTAVFAPLTFTLDVQVITEGGGVGGRVALQPQKALYTYGETVQLTAVANPGWRFTGWGGALSGDALQQELAITEDLLVTATFAPERKSTFLPLILNGR
jgi:hypothetical protein